MILIDDVVVSLALASALSGPMRCPDNFSTPCPVSNRPSHNPQAVTVRTWTTGLSQLSMQP